MTPRRPRKGMQQHQKAGLRPAKGEGFGHSADADGLPSGAPRKAAASPSMVDDKHGVKWRGVDSPEKLWLLAQLALNGAEKPRANLDKHDVWHCGDGPRKLGALPAACVTQHDEDAVLKLFGMMRAVAVTIKKGPFPVLWAAALCTRWVKQQLLLGLMREQVTSGVAPMTWANRRSVELAEEWRAAELARGQKRSDERATANGSTVLGSGLLNFAATRTLADFSRWKARQSSEKGPPWATSLTFDVKGTDARIERDGDGVTCKLAMLGMVDGHRQTQPIFCVSPEGGSAWSTVRAIIDGEFEQRGVKVVRTAEGQWLLKVSYRSQRPATLAGEGALVIRRSMLRFLVAMGSDGRVPRKKLDAAGILAVKRQLSARQHEAHEHLEHQGRGARGHGKARFTRLLRRLEDKGARYSETWCQQQAAFIIGQAVEMGYARVLLETFEGGSIPQAGDRRFERLLRRFPFGKLRQCIMHAGLKVGMSVKLATPGKVAECPVCVEPMGMYNDEGLLRCPACGCAGEPDTIAVWRLCLAGEVECAGVVARAGKDAARWKAAHGGGSDGGGGSGGARTSQACESVTEAGAGV